MKSNNANRIRSLLPLASAVAVLAMANANAQGAAGQIAWAPGSVGAGGAYTFTIGNSGVAAVSDLQVFQNGDAGVTCASSTAQGREFSLAGGLGAGDSVQCSGSALGATSRNTAAINATGKYANGVPFHFTAHQTYVPLAVPTDAIVGINMGAVFNDANSNQTFDSGETFSFSFTVFNFGNLSLSAIGVTDTLGTTISCPSTTLAAGVAMKCTSTYTLTAADITSGFLQDSATVSATGSGNQHVSSQDSVFRTGSTAAEIKGLKSPILTIDKDGNGIASAGDQVRYTFAITNSGNQVLDPIGLTEPDPTRIDGPITCSATTTGGSAFAGINLTQGNGGSLAVGDSELCTATYTITTADVKLGEADNNALITGSPPFGGAASASAASAFVVPKLPPVAIVPSPINDWRAMLMLGIGLLAFGFAATRRRKQRQ